MQIYDMSVQEPTKSINEPIIRNDYPTGGNRKAHYRINLDYEKEWIS